MQDIGQVLGWITSMLKSLELFVYLKAMATILIVIAFWNYFTKRGE